MSIINSLPIFKQSELRKKLGQNRNQLYRLAYSWSHDPVLSDDLAQETLSKALRNISQLRDASVLDKWLYGIMANCWRDHFRKKREFENIDSITLTSKHTPEGQYEKDTTTKIVRRAVATLPEGQRQVLTLVDLEECSYTDVAEILGIPIGTVMSRLCRARKLLAQILLEQQPAGNKSKNHLRRVK